MTRKTLEELAAGYALGALEPAEAAQLEALAAHDPEVRAVLSEFMETAAALATAESPRVVPAEGLRSRVLAAAAATPQIPRATPGMPVPAGFAFTLAGPEGWIETGSPGFRIKVLSGTPGGPYQVILGQLAPGGKVPDHDHHGAEDLYVISGHLQTEGRLLGPGDFLHAEPGTHHHELISPDGCMALLVMGPLVAT